jgi:flagellar basal-body rod protein FlgB
MQMVGNDSTTQVLTWGLAAASLRHSVTANNIANLNTPGFKGSHVQFEAELAAALDRGVAPSGPRIVQDTQTLGRPDGNNVDVESEMVTLAENQLWYSAMTRQLSDHFARLESVIHDGRR